MTTAEIAWKNSPRPSTRRSRRPSSSRKVASKLKPLPFFKPADYKWQPEVQDFRSRVSLAMTIRSRFDVGSAARSRDAQDQRDIETINAILALDELAATQKRRRMLLDMLAELY